MLTLLIPWAAPHLTLNQGSHYFVTSLSFLPNSKRSLHLSFPARCSCWSVASWRSCPRWTRCRRWPSSARRWCGRRRTSSRSSRAGRPGWRWWSTRWADRETKEHLWPERRKIANPLLSSKTFRQRPQWQDKSFVSFGGTKAERYSTERTRRDKCRRPVTSLVCLHNKCASVLLIGQAIIACSMMNVRPPINSIISLYLRWSWTAPTSSRPSRCWRGRTPRRTRPGWRSREVKKEREEEKWHSQSSWEAFLGYDSEQREI